jgi:hypothetical protein
MPSLLAFASIHQKRDEALALFIDPRDFALLREPSQNPAATPAKRESRKAAAMPMGRRRTRHGQFG